MIYPSSCIFDIQTLIDASQPDTILVIGDSSVCNDYMQQRELINKPCKLTSLRADNIQELQKLNDRFDLAIVLDTMEHLDKKQGQQLLAQLRDIYAEKFCIALPIGNDTDQWQQADLFAFAMTRVNEYQNDKNQSKLALYKYDLNSYKKTPDWLNPDNWANPKMWNKFRW